MDNPDHCCTNLVEKETISQPRVRLAGGGSSGDGDSTWPETFQQRAQLSWKKRQVSSLSVTSATVRLTPPVLKQEGILERE